MAATDSAGSTAAPRRTGAGARAVGWLLALIVLAIGGWQLRAWWRLRVHDTQQAGASGADSGDDAMTALDALRRGQRALAQRMSDADANAQVLRDEVLGMGERAALLEQAVARLSGPRAQTDADLRLDEAELLLTIGQQQLQLSADAGAALRAYTLADATLAGSADPAVLNLRQSLAQEIAALRALPPDPRAELAGRLDAFEANLRAQPDADPARRDTHASTFDRVLGSLVEVRRSEQQDLLDPAARDAALTSVRLELTLARLALERRDADAFRAALDRIEGWLPRLFAPPVVARQREQLDALRKTPLRVELPTLGGTLAELRRLRQASSAADAGVAPAATGSKRAH